MNICSISAFEGLFRTILSGNISAIIFDFKQDFSLDEAISGLFQADIGDLSEKMKNTIFVNFEGVDSSKLQKSLVFRAKTGYLGHI